MSAGQHANRSGKSVYLLMGAMVLGGAATVADASFLVPGGTLAPVPAEADLPGGVVVDGGVALPFAGVGYTGTLTTTVFTGDISNPFGINRLTFAYLLTNDASSAHVLHRLTITDFVTALTDVSYQSTSTGVVPSFADRSTTDVIGFQFQNLLGGSEIDPGMQSRLLVVQTDATTYAPTIATVIDGSSANVASFAPSAAVGIPEPGSAALLGTAGAALLARRRRRRCA